MRADQFLVEGGLASSRSQAQRLIAAGVQWRLDDAPWKRVLKNGDEVPAAAQMQLLDAAEARYVSRGGLKLEHALRTTGVQVAGQTCLDVGQSTGGFTDCLLKHGAARVVGVDVGSGQLHASLRADPRVLVLEKLNARSLSAEDLQAAAEGIPAGADMKAATADNLVGAFSGPPASKGRLSAAFGSLSAAKVGLHAAIDSSAAGAASLASSDDSQTFADPAVAVASRHSPAGPFEPAFPLIVADLSFISLTLVLPALVALLHSGGAMLLLVKPQFELQPGQVGKGGIVRDASLFSLVETRLRDACAAQGLAVRAWFESHPAGGDGNREFFIHATSLLRESA